MTDRNSTYPVSPVLYPMTAITDRASMMHRFPTFEAQRTGDGYDGAALTIPGRMLELVKRSVLAELGDEWACIGVEVGGRRV